MKDCFTNLEKIEFVVTNACTGRCKHCSQGAHETNGRHIDPQIAAETVARLTERYKLKTVMTFGGEPLLYPDAVYAVMKEATKSGVPKRQVITNGYFSKDINVIREVAERLAESGVNDLLVSVDAFHGEFIPVSIVEAFATEAKKTGVKVRTQPAWLGGRLARNAYNNKTEELLCRFRSLGIEANEGNDIFPEGNAVKYFAEYFVGRTVENPYIQDPYNVKCISVDPDGSVLGNNLYTCDIFEIMREYSMKNC